MRKTYCIELDSNDLGQLLEGLDMRADAWEKTEAYLLGVKFREEEFFMPEECHQPEEANAIAAHYRSIIEQITVQMEAQR